MESGLLEQQSSLPFAVYSIGGQVEVRQIQDSDGGTGQIFEES